MPIGIGKFQSPADKKAALIAAAKAKADAATPEEAKIVKYIPPAQCTDRSRLVFDDSGSMFSEIPNAKKGVVEYLKNCIPNQTACALHFMNTSESKFSSALRSDLPALAQDILEAELASGGTPFFNTCLKALKATPVLTRLIVFTDGSPTDQLDSEKGDELQSSGWGYSHYDRWISSADVLIKVAHNIGDPMTGKGSKNSGKYGPCIPIDSVFFGSEHNKKEIELLKYLSEQTGGFFLHFNPAKVNFAQAFKYLAPVNRLRLTDGAFRKAIEDGKV